jgi:ferritin-like metal-binding protein YciE
MAIVLHIRHGKCRTPDVVADLFRSNTMSMDNLKELFVEELRDVLSAERQLVKALPKMAKGSSSEELRAGFEKHLAETEGQVQRLEQVFSLLGETLRAKNCKAMEGLIEEGAEIIEKDGDPVTKDAALICAAQKVEHYEIAVYGTLVTWAKQLGLENEADLLSETLQEERTTDESLTALAESSINQSSAAE